MMNKNQFDKWLKENDTDETTANAVEWLLKARYGENPEYDKAKDVILFEETIEGN